MSRSNLKIVSLTFAALLALTVTGCATSGKEQAVATTGDEQISDPLETMNRGIFAFNEVVDKNVMEPVARGYRYVAPKPVRNSVRNFLHNLKSPVIMGNELLQGDLKGLGNATGRLVINTLLGVGGLFDVADMGGIPYEAEDFGQTLATWGVGHGPYLMLPIFGPSSVRDGTGMVVDSLADPVRIYMFNNDMEALHYGRVAVGAIDQREELLDVIDDLRRNSFDYYAALRSAYTQRRAALVQDMDPSTSAGPAIPDYQ